MGNQLNEIAAFQNNENSVLKIVNEKYPTHFKQLKAAFFNKKKREVNNKHEFFLPSKAKKEGAYSSE